MKAEIIDTVVKVMLPLGEAPAAKNALDEANQIILKLVTLAPGKTEPELSNDVARRKLKDVLAQMGYEAEPGERGNNPAMRRSHPQRTKGECVATATPTAPWLHRRHAHHGRTRKPGHRRPKQRRRTARHLN